MTKTNIFNLSEGNKKLKNTNSVRFLIWNIPSVITCPYRTPSCEALCYAKKAEKAYPNCLGSRQANFEASRQSDFVERMIATIEYHLARKAFKGKKVVFRIHESGDFYNKAYAMAWVEIARHFEGLDIVFMAYTKSLIYFEGVDVPECMTVRASLWDDSTEAYKELAKKYPSYTAYDPETLKSAVASGACVECKCEDCGNCLKCMDKTVKAIAVEIH